jgi:MFS family permease
MGKKISNLLGLNHNALVISVTELIHDSGSHLIWSFWSLYVLQLGGSITILGLFTLLTGVSSLILHPLLGYVSDRIGRKKPIVVGGFIVAFFPLLLSLSNSWLWLIPGVILRAMDNGLWITRQALFTDNIDPNRRGRSIATFYTIMSLTASFLPVVGGILLDRIGMVDGFRIGLWFSFVTLLIQSSVNAKYLKDQPHVKTIETDSHENSLKGFIADFIKPIRANKEYQRLLFGQMIVSISQGLFNQFTIIYAVESVGLSATDWGLVTSVSGLMNLVFRIPIGAAVDKIDNIRGYMLGIFIQSVFPILFYNSGTFYQIVAVYSLNTMGGTFSQMGREALLVEVIPSKERGVLLGSFTAIAGNGGAFGSLSPSFGALIWSSYGPGYTFYLGAAISLSALIFYQRTFLRNNGLGTNVSQ